MPMTNEPTTGEIVRAFRGAGIYGITTALELRIIDRLESQEREIEELKSEAIVNALENAERIADLTARAESAERERKAAVNALTLYEDALLDECDRSYQSGFMDGFRSREEIDDED